ncbi:hypothetical protein K435DRAFT_806919 [Dendrothele bispora CBS 962.96]|uniref:G-protein coupled receptors family 1 profile domain-containing protein n=1 Tax=Dendrothele bispora (strain CBS 962.96) TaxID=1314807 RepID=A0A4V4HCP2_DENBC|nr:hypothetical protein K435DRAFT_806919 [Dendrothele bispora CBS 962.96]
MSKPASTPPSSSIAVFAFLLAVNLNFISRKILESDPINYCVYMLSYFVLVYFTPILVGNQKDKSIVLFLLGTLGLILDSSAMGLLFTKFSQSTYQVKIIETIVLVTLNLSSIMTHILLIYRLFVIWGRQLKIIAFPIITGVTGHVFSMLSTFNVNHNGYNYLNASRQERLCEAVAVLIVACSSLLITGLTALRIWWIWKTSKGFIGHKIQAHYRAIIIIVIESGFITPLSAFLSSAAIFLELPLNPVCLLIQIEAIVPALITVQVNLGMSTEAVKDDIPKLDLVS